MSQASTPRARSTREPSRRLARRSGMARSRLSMQRASDTGSKRSSSSTISRSRAARGTENKIRQTCGYSARCPSSSSHASVPRASPAVWICQSVASKPACVRESTPVARVLTSRVNRASCKRPTSKLRVRSPVAGAGLPSSAWLQAQPCEPGRRSVADGNAVRGMPGLRLRHAAPATTASTAAQTNHGNDRIARLPRGKRDRSARQIGKQQQESDPVMNAHGCAPEQRLAAGSPAHDETSLNRGHSRIPVDARRNAVEWSDPDPESRRIRNRKRKRK